MQKKFYVWNCFHAKALDEKPELTNVTGLSLYDEPILHFKLLTVTFHFPVILSLSSISFTFPVVPFPLLISSLPNDIGLYHVGGRGKFKMYRNL